MLFHVLLKISQNLLLFILILIVSTSEIGNDRFHNGPSIIMLQDELCVSFKASTPETESNFFDLAAESYTYKQIASMLGVHTELTMIKSQLLNIRVHSYMFSILGLTFRSIFCNV